MTTLRTWAACCHVACRADCAVHGFAVDSRAVKPHDLFFALPGLRTDGHAFLQEAARRGAVGAVVSRQYTGDHFNLALIPVEDVLNTLQDLARECLKKAHPRVIAVTGSVGKTTTKEWIYQLLKHSGHTHSNSTHTVRTPGSYNSQIGLPLSILNLFGTLQPDDQIPSTFVAEMGMTEPGNIKKLISIAPPDFALLTAVSLVQAERFSGEEAIAMEKGCIFASPKTQIGVMPSDVAGFDALQTIGSCMKRTFSLKDPKADYHIYQAQEKDTLVYTLKTPHGLYPLGTWHVPGRHALYNLLAACAISCECGLNPEQIPAVLPKLCFPERRMQPVMRQGVLFINDSYNAPPIGVEAALSALPKPSGNGLRIAVLGTMPELGAFSHTLHEKIGHIALNTVDILLTLGAETLPMHKVWQKRQRPSYHFTSKQELSHALNALIKPDDVVLVKGKNTLQMWTLIEGES